MSRSNPQDNAPNPATRWFEWNGEAGAVRYYDKAAKKNIDVPLPFTFMLLDELATVRGWHEPSQSGIYANEVRDTRQDVLIVKAFKGGTLAEGLYKDIKDRVNTVGAGFNANCYIAFKNGDERLSIGAIRFKGAALGAWMEFRKTHRSNLYEQAIEVHGYDEGKKGRVIFRVPKFRLKALSSETNAQAVALDKSLQAFLADYLKRTKREQADVTAAHHDEPQPPDWPNDDAPYMNDEPPY
jgi:hypothetical protein